jgi:prepilin-type N-terminal cleavage/methylation domain-containing protein
MTNSNNFKSPTLSSKRSNRGFTLVELLIVVAIIAIIAAIAIPQFNRYTVKAKIAALESDLKNAYNAAQGYMMEYGAGLVVNSLTALEKNGFKTSSNVEIVEINIGLDTGYIKLTNNGLDLNIVDTKVATIHYDGTRQLPKLK